MIDPKLKPVADAIRAGNTVDAIRLLREATGMSLIEAKEAVEHLSAEEARAQQATSGTAAVGATPSSDYHFATEVGKDLQALRAPRDPNTPRLESALADEVLVLVRANNYLEAIKLVRVRTGADIKTAKDQVEMVMQENGIAKPGNKSCALILAILLLAVGMVAAFLFAQ